MCALMCSLLNPLQSTLLLPTSVRVITLFEWRFKPLSIEFSINKLHFFLRTMIFFIPHYSKDVILSGEVCIHRSLRIVRGHVCDVRLLNQPTDLRAPRSVEKSSDDIATWYWVSAFIQRECVHHACMINSIYCPNRPLFFDQDQNELQLVALSGAPCSIMSYWNARCEEWSLTLSVQCDWALYDFIHNNNNFMW